MTKKYFGLLLYMMMAVIKFSESYDPLISQISPKSISKEDENSLPLETSMNIDMNDSSVQNNGEAQHTSTPLTNNMKTSKDKKTNKSKHIRVERSAFPILNEIPSQASIGYEELQHLNDDTLLASDQTGRYINFDINPTQTIHKFDENYDDLATTTFAKTRQSKNINDNSFLLKRGPRLESISGPPQTLNNATLMESTVNNLRTIPNDARQNPNPDIQDIITGIVKLLNGNVNVHANTQTSRRPIPSRINNRGPPRITESQPIPIEYELSPTSSIHPPPYPFERPDAPVRPFINGVPLPEQIVPTMQQNYRPGFISQNRPPWQRPRPRPIPNTSRRPPFPSYKPMPPQPEYHTEDEIQITTLDSDSSIEKVETTTEEIINSEHQSDNNSNHDNINENINNNNNHYNYEDEEITKEKEENFSQNNKKKDEYMKKKDKNPTKIIEKKTVMPTSQPTTLLQNEIEPTNVKESVHTIIETVSEINVSKEIHESIDENIEPTAIQSSMEDVVSDKTTTTTTSTMVQNTPELPESTKEPTITPTQVDVIGETQTTTTTTTTNTYTNNSIESQYLPRPGIVLDDPEFKPGGHKRPTIAPQQPRPPIQPTRPPGYGEIFDVTLSAIQGPGSGTGSKQTINIKPYGSYPTTNGGSDIIVSPNEDDGFVSIDGKRTYINLFGDATDDPSNNIQPTTTVSNSKNIRPTQLIPPGVTGTGYAVAETEVPPQKSQPQSNRPLHYRPLPQQPPVRIDTCIVGDDSTCDQAQNEKCKTDSGVSSCHCRPGYSRRKHREPCRKVVSIVMSLRVDKIYDRRIAWDQQLSDVSSDPYSQLSFEAIRAIDSAMSMTPYSDEFMKAKVNKIYQGEPDEGVAGVFVNLTLMLDENGETLRPSIKNDVQRHLLGVIHRRNNNIGNSALYVESPPGAVSRLQDLDECSSSELNDCHQESVCINLWGSFRCECNTGLRDPWVEQPHRAGRECVSCSESHCNNRGSCNYDMNNNQVCTCAGSYYGSQCEIDGEVLGVAIGASVAAVIIIVLTLICLVMWSRRWHREQKNAMGSPVFGYMTAPVKSAMNQGPYQVSLEDRMRWAQIADIMAQANHYGAEPIGASRPSSTMYGYPTLQAIGNMNNLANMSNLGTMSMAGTLPIHQTTLPPIPLPRLNLHSRSNGMRALENSSSSEEEDRTDLLGRNFHVPRPKSRSNNSITNQSGIYYDVDYAPSGGGNCNENIYGVTMQSNSIPGPQGIPMSTYTAGKAPSSYFMK